MKRGFTLVELLGTIVILSLIVIIAFPAIISQLKKSNETVDASAINVVESAARKYMQDNKEQYRKALDSTPGKLIKYSSINVTELVDKNYLQETFTDKHEELLKYKVCLYADTQKYRLKVILAGETCPDSV